MILKHISGMLCLLISYSKFTRTCSIFNLTEECTFDIIQAERTNVPEQIFLCEVCYESTEECIPYDGQRVKII